MKKLNKIVMAMQVMLCLGVTATVLAEPGQSNLTTSPNGHGDFDASQFKLDMILAKRGDADAQYYVGNAYEEGRGTPKDLHLAFQWYTKAAQLNQSEAQFKLGYFYEHGLGVKRDMNKAMVWYKLATKTSHGTVRARLHREAFAHRTDDKAQAQVAVRVEQAKQDKARQQAEERKQAEEHKRQRSLAQERARLEAARKQQTAAQPKHVAVVPELKPVAIVQINIPDISDVILKNQWHDGSSSADYLPSQSTHCLRSSGSEIVCFSDEKQRVITGQRVRYYYNAIRMEMVSRQGVNQDPNGLKLEQGWQEPQLALNCRTTDRVNLYCARGSFKLHYRH